MRAVFLVSGQPSILMHCSRLVVLVAAVLGTPLLAWAQYQWIDASGHRVYSDRPAPAGTPEDRIIGGAAVKVAPAPTPAMQAVEPPADQDAVALRQKLQQADADRKAERQTQQVRLASARAENCRRARDYQRLLDSGMRIAQLNGRGERIVLDDAARAQELQRTRTVIADSCSAAPH